MDGHLPPRGDALLLALSRGLSPACCKVLIALMMAGSALDVAALELWTSMERMALGRALKALKGLDLVVPQTGLHNRQMWVPVGDSFFSAFQLMHNASAEPLLTTTTIEARARSKVVVEGQLMQYTATGIEQPTRTPEFSANLAACQQFGITEPVASELSAREWVNPGYIEAHMQGLQDWDTRGLAVVRMRAGEEPPGWDVPKVSRKRQDLSTPTFGTVSQRDQRGPTRSASEATVSELMDQGEGKIEAQPGGVAPALHRTQRGASVPPERNAAGTPVPAPELVPGAGATPAAQRVLLEASGLAALPPSEYARIEQVRAMISAYGEEKTLSELRAQREQWSKIRGRNGRYYSPLHMGWVDRADESLSGHGPPPQPERPILPPPPLFTGRVPKPPDVPLPKFLQQKRHGEE